MKTRKDTGQCTRPKKNNGNVGKIPRKKLCVDLIDPYNKW